MGFEPRFLSKIQSPVSSECNLWDPTMFHTSGDHSTAHGMQPEEDTSTYLHEDAGYCLTTCKQTNCEHWNFC